MPAVACWKMPSTESEATMPKLSGAFGFNPRSTRRRPAASSLA
jgi:hypothetical protein